MVASHHFMAGEVSSRLLYTEDSTITLVYRHGEVQEARGRMSVLIRRGIMRQCLILFLLNTAR